MDFKTFVKKKKELNEEFWCTFVGLIFISIGTSFVLIALLDGWICDLSLIACYLFTCGISSLIYRYYKSEFFKLQHRRFRDDEEV